MVYSKKRIVLLLILGMLVFGGSHIETKAATSEASFSVSKTTTIVEIPEDKLPSTSNQQELPQTGVNARNLSSLGVFLIFIVILLKRNLITKTIDSFCD